MYVLWVIDYSVNSLNLTRLGVHLIAHPVGVIMKQYIKLLLAMPFILLAGCNSSSSSNENQAAKPVADYTFSSEKLADLVDEKVLYLDRVKLTLDGRVYDKTEFAISDGSEGLLLAKLVDLNENKVDVWMDFNSGECAILPENGEFDRFDCASDKREVSGDFTLIQSITLDDNQSLDLEYYTGGLEDIATIGSTILTAVEQDTRIDITTTFAFDDFFRAIDDDDIGSTLGLTTYIQLNDIVEEFLGSNKDKWLLFDSQIDGSMDDDINMYTGLIIHDHEINTVVTPDGSVFSGGTDLFAAGKTRTLQRAREVDDIASLNQIGVHSWGEGDKTAKDFPYTDESHRKQATYFNEVMGDKGIDFYMFTLDSAPFDGEYWVTKADSDKYDLITHIE